MEANTRIYRNLKQINIITFWEIAESENYAMMDIDYSEDKQYANDDLLFMQTGFMGLYDDYFSYKDDSRQRITLQENDKHTKESFKLNLLNEQYKTLQILEFNRDKLPETDFNEYLQQTYTNIISLDKRARINRLDTIKFNAEKLERLINALNQKLLLSEKRTKQQVNNEAKKFRNHYENITPIEQILERSIGDISKINALQWLAYEKEAERLIKHKKQNGSRKPHN